MSSASSASKRARKMISPGESDEKRWSPPDSRRRFETRHNGGTRDASRNSHHNWDWGGADGPRCGRWQRDDWSSSRRGRGGRPIEPNPSLPPRRHLHRQESVSSSSRGSLWHVSKSSLSPPHMPWIRSQIPKLWRREEEDLSWQLPERSPQVSRNVRRSKDVVVIQDASNTTTVSPPCPHPVPPPPLGMPSPPSSFVTTMGTTTDWVWGGNPRNDEEDDYDDNDDDDDDLCDYSEVEDELEERIREWGAQSCAPLGGGAIAAHDDNSGKCGGPAIAWDDNSNGNSNDSGGSVVTQVGGANGGSGGGLLNGGIGCATTPHESPTQLVPPCLGVGGWAKAQEGNTNEWIAHSLGAFVSSAEAVQEGKRHAEWEITQEGTTQSTLHCLGVVGLGHVGGQFKKAKEGNGGKWGMHPFGSFLASVEVVQEGDRHEERAIVHEVLTQSGPRCLDVGLGLGGQVKKAQEGKDDKWGVHPCNIFVASKEDAQEGNVHSKRAIVQDVPTQSGPHFFDVGLAVGGHATNAQEGNNGKWGVHPCGAFVARKEAMQEGDIHAKWTIVQEAGPAQSGPHCLDVDLGVGGQVMQAQEGNDGKCGAHLRGAFVVDKEVMQKGTVHTKWANAHEGSTQLLPPCIDVDLGAGDQVRAQEGNASKWGVHPCGAFVASEDVVQESNKHAKWAIVKEDPTHQLTPHCLDVSFTGGDQVKAQVKAQEGNVGEWGEHSRGTVVGGKEVVQEDNKNTNQEIAREGLAHLGHQCIVAGGQVSTQQGNDGNWGAYPHGAFVGGKEVVQEGKKHKKWENETHNVIGGCEIPKEGNNNQDGNDKGANHPRGDASDGVAQEGMQSIDDENYQKKCMVWTQACKLSWLYLNQASSY